MAFPMEGEVGSTCLSSLTPFPFHVTQLDVFYSFFDNFGYLSGLHLHLACISLFRAFHLFQPTTSVLAPAIRRCTFISEDICATDVLCCAL